MPGAKPKYQQFLRVLQEVTGTNNTQLSQMTGIKAPNLSAYLTGGKPTGKQAVERAIQHLSEWSVAEDLTMLSIANKNTISTRPGIYFIYDSAGNCVYLGQAKNLRTEVAQRLKAKPLRHGIWRDPLMKLTRYKIKAVAAYVTTFRVESSRLRHNLEALFLLTFINQTQNKKKGKFR